MNLVRKLLCADECRKSRFHDEKGNLVSARNLFLNGPKAITTFALHSLINFRPEVPWISYNAIHEINRNLRSDSVVLEFGSGYSTMFFAKRCFRVFSVESNPKWFEIVQTRLDQNKCSNVVYELRSDSTYAAFPQEELLFDFILIDGIMRSQCLKNALPRLRPGGLIYLDNSDKDSRPPGGDMRLAEKCLSEEVLKRNGWCKVFTDFAVAQLTPNQGMLAMLP